MSGEPDPPGGEIEALIRDLRARDEAAVDPGAILDGVRARLAGPAPGRRAGLAPRWGVGLAAAALVLGLTWSLAAPRGRVEAAVLVRDARRALAIPADRLYDVRIEPLSDRIDPRLLLSSKRTIRVRTRGDRFWVSARRDTMAWSWGRDEVGRLWLAATESVGLTYDAAEVPARMAATCDVVSMDLDAILADLLGHFDVAVEAETPDGASRIRATPRPGRRPARLAAATLEIDPVTKAVTRAVLTRAVGGEPAATVTFRLVEAGSRPDDEYRLAGHLPAGATILGPDRPLRRKAALAAHYGRVFAPAPAESP